MPLLTTATARAEVKRRLDIDSTVMDFDSAIDAFVLSGVSKLYPIAQREVEPQTVVATTDEHGEAVISLSGFTTPLLGARKVEYSGGNAWYPVESTLHHGTSLMLRDLPTSTGLTVRIFGLTSFTLTDVPEFLQQSVFWYAMSEFYDYLAGNKRKYNIYTQGGARAVDNMKDEAQFFEQKANVYLNDRTTIYGMI